jgi:60 kDa SS-A/Ro ribonucleoprotein
VDYTKHAIATQREPIQGREPDMAENRAGGYAFTIDKWSQLRRFLVLGSEGGTYYASEREMTRENAGIVVRCWDDEPLQMSASLIAFRDRVPKVSTLTFALALGTTHRDINARTAAYQILSEIC